MFLSKGLSKIYNSATLNENPASHPPLCRTIIINSIEFEKNKEEDLMHGQEVIDDKTSQKLTSDQYILDLVVVIFSAAQQP